MMLQNAYRSFITQKLLWSFHFIFSRSDKMIWETEKPFSMIVYATFQLEVIIK